MDKAQGVRGAIVFLGFRFLGPQHGCRFGANAAVAPVWR